MKNTSESNKKNLNISINDGKKTAVASFRGFISIDQEMGREIAMMFFKPSKRYSLSKSGHLAGKI